MTVVGVELTADGTAVLPDIVTVVLLKNVPDIKNIKNKPIMFQEKCDSCWC